MVFAIVASATTLADTCTGVITAADAANACAGTFVRADSICAVVSAFPGVAICSAIIGGVTGDGATGTPADAAVTFVLVCVWLCECHRVERPRLA